MSKEFVIDVESLQRAVNDPEVLKKIIEYLKKTFNSIDSSKKIVVKVPEDNK